MCVHSVCRCPFCALTGCTKSCVCVFGIFLFWESSVCVCIPGKFQAPALQWVCACQFNVKRETPDGILEVQSQHAHVCGLSCCPFNVFALLITSKLVFLFLVPSCSVSTHGVCGIQNTSVLLGLCMESCLVSSGSVSTHQCVCRISCASTVT